MSQLSSDARAVVRVLDALTTQVKRLADSRQSDFALTPDALDDDATTSQTTPWTPGPLAAATAAEWTRQSGKVAATIEALTANAGCSEHPNAGSVGPYCLACTIVPPPAGAEDAHRAERRASIRNLLDRAGRGVLVGGTEGELLRQQVEAELRYADQIAAGRATWKAKAEEQCTRAEKAEERAEAASRVGTRYLAAAERYEAAWRSARQGRTEQRTLAEIRIRRLRARGQRIVQLEQRDERAEAAMARWWDARLAELHDAIRPPTGQTTEE